MANNEGSNDNMEPDKKEVILDNVEDQMDTTKSLDNSEKQSIEERPVKEGAPNRFKRFLGTKKGKVVSIIMVVFLLLVVLFSLPVTRYAVAGTFVKKNVRISVSDSITEKPVSGAMVALGSVSAKTDESGVANIESVPVGDYQLQITKNYYKAAAVRYVVPILTSPKESKLEVVATGRQVAINVTDTITKMPLAKAVLTVRDTTAITDDKGSAIIVLPADQEALKGSVQLDGYNQTEVEVKVTEQVDANMFSLTPVGTVHYLSKQTGKINVMKANLDGSDAKVVVEGTGNENDRTTVLLAARDWKYMALLANRSGGKSSQVYLVDGASGKLTTIDEGDAEFQLVGWSDHRFIFVVTRNGKQVWDDKRQALKSYDTENGKLTVIDETAGAGTSYYDQEGEELSNAYILEGKVVYAKVWSLGNKFDLLAHSKKSAIMVANVANSQKQRTKEFGAQRYVSIEAKLYEPQELYFRVALNGTQVSYYEYEGAEVKTITNTDEKFYNSFYPTYLISPSSEKTFWHEPRDGKNALFVGDKNGANSQQLAVQSEYRAYGWYSDKYILLSKNGSELFIAPSDKTLDGRQPVKLTSYHKPALTYPGYGYGYGGQ